MDINDDMRFSLVFNKFSKLLMNTRHWSAVFFHIIKTDYEKNLSPATLHLVKKKKKVIWF